MSHSIKSPKLCEEICKRLASGEPLRVICKDAHMPQYRTVYDWMYEDEVFAANIARAREIGFDVIAEECLEIADDKSQDELVTEYGIQENKEFVNRSKVRIETRLKLLAKWNPKKYGDKIDIDHKTNGQSIQSTILVADQKTNENISELLKRFDNENNESI